MFRGQTLDFDDHAAMAIPVVDLQKVLSSSAGADPGNYPQVEQFNSAFSTVGFVFLIKNHGIPRKLV